MCAIKVGRGLSLFAFFMMACVLYAQNTCDVFINSGFEAQCVLPWEKGIYYMEEPGMFVACQGRSVSYTAIIKIPDTLVSEWQWEVSGGEITWENGGEVTVLWGDGPMGQISVSVVTRDWEECAQTKNVRLIESPVADVSSIPAYTVAPDGLKTIYVCRGETVEFVAQSTTSSTDIVSHYWNSAMEGTSSMPYYRIENIQASGKVSYSVYNNCGCSDAEEFFIEVMDGEPLQLSCYGTVCEDAIVSYTADAPPCEHYFWHVDGGTIEDGQNTPMVTIQWDRPQNGYGIIGIDGTLCGNEACPNMMKKKIPIIQDHIDIEGQSEACIDDAVVYRVPLWGTTEYRWTITPTNGVAVSEMNGANEKTLVFQQAGVYYITVSYWCDFLGCGEYTSETKIVSVKPKLAIKGEERICISHPRELTTVPPVVAQWQVQDCEAGNGYIHSANGTNLNYTFPHPGKYVITATNTAYCQPATFILDVQSTPPSPYYYVPHNALTVCPNEAALLKAYPTNPNHTIIWEPLCSDASPQSISGNEVTIQFGDTICGIRTYTYDRVLGCVSATPYVVSVVRRGFSDIGIQDLSSVCPGEVIPWEVPFQEGMLYRWTIQENRQYCASIQGESMSNKVDIIVHERTSGIYGDTFYVVLERQCCHQIRYDTLRIRVSDQRETPQLTIQPSQTEICPRNVVEFQGSAEDTTRYRWLVDGRLVCTHGNPFRHEFDSSGAYTVSAYYSNMDICTRLEYSDSAQASITVWDKPYILQFFFNGTYIKAHIVSNRPYVCVWYYNGEEQGGEVLDSISFRGNGNYVCRVTNDKGCTTERSIYVGGNSGPTT